MVDPIVTGALVKADQSLSPAARKFAEDVVGGPAQEVGAALADRVRVRRWRSQVRMLEKAAKFAEDRGLDPKEVPVKTLFPLLEAASLEDEDDDEMTDRWASLLANSSDPHGTVPPSYVEILKQLTAFEAQTLDYIYEVACHRSMDEWAWVGLKLSVIVDKGGATHEEALLVCSNLGRLGLVAPQNYALGGRPELAGGVYTDRVCLTRLGYAFVSACREPERVRIPPVKTDEEIESAIAESRRLNSEAASAEASDAAPAGD